MPCWLLSSRSPLTFFLQKIGHIVLITVFHGKCSTLVKVLTLSAELDEKGSLSSSAFVFAKICQFRFVLRYGEGMQGQGQVYHEGLLRTGQQQGHPFGGTGSAGTIETRTIRIRNFFLISVWLNNLTFLSLQNRTIPPGTYNFKCV